MSAVDWDIPVNFRIRRGFPARAGGDAGEVARALGLRRRIVETFYSGFHIRLSAGQIVAVIGPSGAGKSLLLEAAASAVPGAIRVDPARAASDGRSAVEAAGMKLGLSERLSVLSRCGLAEAMVLLTPAGLLSAGQLFRLALARAICRILADRGQAKPRLLLIDEFAAALDAVTAEVLARQMGRLARRYRLGMIILTHRLELLEALHPDAIIVKPLGEAPRTVSLPDLKPARARLRFRVTRGAIADYRVLERFHYLAGPPAAHKRVWTVRAPPRLRQPGGPEVAAVLVVSPPVLNCRGRNAATAGRYVSAGGGRRAAVMRLNAEMECISRVIVHPMFRSCGLAVRLVRHAVRHASTPLVEALASMGAIHPFFELAGMRCYGRFAGKSQQYFYYLVQTSAGVGCLRNSGGYNIRKNSYLSSLSSRYFQRIPDTGISRLS